MEACRRGMIFIAGGPRSIERVLDRLLARSGGKPGTVATAYKRLWMWAEMQVRRLGRTSGFEPLIGIIERHVLDNLSVTERTRIMGRRPQGSRFVGIMTAAAELGVNTIEVHRLARKAPEGLRAGAGPGRIPAEMVAELKKLMDEEVFASEASRILGVNSSTFQLLRKAGQMDELVTTSTGYLRYSRSALESWVAGLAGPAPEMTDCPEGCVTLVASRYAQCSWIIRWVAQGVLPVVGRIPDRGLKGILVRRDDLRRISTSPGAYEGFCGEADSTNRAVIERRTAPPPENSISAPEVAAMLGVRTHWLVRKRKCGELPFRRIGRYRDVDIYSRADVTAFAASHRNVVQAAVEFSLPQKRLLARLTAVGVSPTVSDRTPAGTWFREAELGPALGRTDVPEPGVPRTKRPKAFAAASPDGWVPLVDAATALGFSRSYLYRLLDAADPPFAVVKTGGGHRRISRTELEAFVRTHVTLSAACGGTGLRVTAAITLLSARGLAPVWRGLPKYWIYRRADLEPVMGELLALVK